MSNEEKDSLTEEMWDFMEILASAEDTFIEGNGEVLSAVDLGLFNEWRSLCGAFQDFCERVEMARNELAGEGEDDEGVEEWED